MFFRKALFTIALLFISPCFAFSAIFNVTSKNDSGTGTLREALTMAAANGSLVKDFINFSLPGLSETDRTIIITSALPDVTANLVIDGSTQPGLFFGVSHAKVAVFFDVPVTPEFSGFRIFGQDSAIYGLYIKNITDLSHADARKLWAGIEVVSLLTLPSKNIIIGAPGKGNVIMGFSDAFKTARPQDVNVNYENVYYENFIVQDNFFGIDIDGNSFNSTDPGIFTIEEGYGSILIGGLNMGEKNVFGAGCHLIYDTDYTSMVPTTVNIYGNNIGVNAAGDKAAFSSGGLMISRSFQNISAAFNIENNVIACFDWPAIFITNTESVIHIKRNHIGVDRSGTIDFGTRQSIMITYSSGTTFIGSDDIEDANVMAFARQPLLFSETGPVLVKKNSIYCVTTLQPMIDFPFPSFEPPVVEITSSGSNFVAGTATANSNIELFYTDRCNSCSPETYFASVSTDGTGNWRYDGLITNSVIASANIDGKSSEFSKAAINTTLDFSMASVKSAGCGLSDGSIKNVIVQNQHLYIYKWLDAENNIVSTSIDLTNASAGVYRLEVNRGNCASLYSAPISIPQSEGYTLDESAVIVSASTCGNLNGAIKNITVQGAGDINYTWTNEQSVIVGTSKDLINVGPGKYRLQIKAGETCPLIYSSIIEVLEKDVIILDESQVVTLPAGCTGNTGSIKGITVTGASKYEWLNEANVIYETTTVPELVNAPAGTYQLKASNSSCNKESQVYTISQIQPIPFPSPQLVKVYPCAESKGSLRLIFENTVNMPKVRWENQNGSTVSTSAFFGNADPGIYRLFFTDANNCEQLVRTYNLPSVLPVRINESALVVTPDACGKGIASISGIQVAQGKGPFKYSWKDDNGNVIGNAVSISGLHAGKYHLAITDSTSCSVTSVYTITDRTDIIIQPEVPAVQICAPGDAVVFVSHPQGNYKIYDSFDSETALAESDNGIFKMNVQSTRQYFVSHVSGTCESSRTPVTVNISTEQLQVPNTFTPNGDGINDFWIIHNLQSYPKGEIQIYNRYGSQVFRSIGYPAPFSGKLNGTDLPAGVYYFIIDLKAGCKLITGSITIIR